MNTYESYRVLLGYFASIFQVAGEKRSWGMSFISSVDHCCAVKNVGSINLYLDEVSLICSSRWYQLAS